MYESGQHSQGTFAFSRYATKRFTPNGRGGVREIDVAIWHSLKDGSRPSRIAVGPRAAVFLSRALANVMALNYIILESQGPYSLVGGLVVRGYYHHGCGWIPIEIVPGEPESFRIEVSTTKPKEDK